MQSPPPEPPESTQQDQSQQHPQRPRHNPPAINLPPLTKLLLAAILLIYVAQGYLSQITLYQLAFVPGRYTSDTFLSLSALFSPLSHMFLHAGLAHLMFNAATLCAFGAGVERALGARKMLVLFILSGFAGAATHFAFHPYETIPVIGASGGISGLFGAVLVMINSGQQGSFNKNGLTAAAALWIGMSLFFGVIGMPGQSGAIAWSAHIGGFIAGILLFSSLSGHKKSY